MYRFTTWPAEPERMQRYRKFEELYRGEHHKAFAKRINKELYKQGRDGLTFLEIDYPKTIVNVPADLLVGQPPVISYPDADQNAALKQVMNRSGFDEVLLELVQDTGFRGDGVLVARDSPRGVVVEPKPAYSYFPKLDPDNVRQAISEQLAWHRPFEDRMILRVDRYLPGQVAREAYWLEGLEVGKPIKGATLAQVLGGHPAILPTGIAERNTLVHVPNTRSSNEWFGRSDYAGGITSLFEEVDWCYSQISKILAKHAKPKITGPELNLPKFENGMVDLSQLDYLVTQGDKLPQYLTWDAQLLAAFTHLKNVCDEIFRHAGIAPMLAGYVAGARYDSGRAFRMQMSSTLALVARKGLYLDRAIKEILRIAVAMELGIPYEELDYPHIRWRDGLPKDTAQDSQTENNRIAAKTTSRLDAIQRLDDCDEPTARGVLERIALEDKIFGGLELPKRTETPEAGAPDTEPGQGSEEDE